MNTKCFYILFFLSGSLLVAKERRKNTEKVKGKAQGCLDNAVTGPRYACEEWGSFPILAIIAD